MIASTALLLATVVIFAAAALIMREGLAQKLGQSLSTSSTDRRPKRVVPMRHHAAYEPTYCYHDCMRVHAHTDPNFPCSVACSAKDGSYF